MKFEIKNRFTREVQIEAEIECGEDESYWRMLGLAVKWSHLRGVNLGGANLEGADLRGANLGVADLRGADLGEADLRGTNLKNANLEDVDLRGADLRGANLRGANLESANLAGANLVDANLGGANLRGANLGGADLANQLAISAEDIPIIPNIDATILSALEAGGRLDMRYWHGSEHHWCGTTHCRAGWAVHLAGDKGKALEDRVGPHVAGALIYQASRPGQPAPWFFGGEAEALNDIKKCAEEQRT